MTRLASLHHGLQMLRRERQVVRIGMAVAFVASLVLAILLGIYFIDVMLHMGRLERVILLLLFLAGLAYMIVKWVMPALLSRESDVELALIIEREQGISSDLVAALQFEDGHRSQYGSSDLRDIVIDYTAEVSGEIDYLEGCSREQLKKRGMTVGGVFLIWLLLFAIWPSHTSAFFARLTTSDVRYPTHTRIVGIEAPGERVAYGDPVQFIVKAEGREPRQGQIHLRTESTGLATQIELKSDADDPMRWTATLPRALDNLSYYVQLGDDYTDRREVTLIRPPVVDMELEVQTPDYARASFGENNSGLRHTVVLAGSTVIPRIRADKPLREAVLQIGGEAYPLRRDGERFVLDDPESPLRDLKETIRYQLQITDTDGLELEMPITGVIRVRPDREPAAAVGALTRLVTPQASVALRYKAEDDYGLASLTLVKRVVRQEGEATEQRIGLHELAGAEAEVEGRYQLDFNALDIARGDRVEITVEATDFRGESRGELGASDKLVFHVTDRTGWLDATHPELDEQLDRRLDEIIQTQLGIGR